MLLKMLVYVYTQKVYSSLKIAKALWENIHFMWLIEENRLDFRTINRFRGSRMKGGINDVFAVVIEYLIGGKLTEKLNQKIKLNRRSAAMGGLEEWGGKHWRDVPIIQRPVQTPSACA